RRVEAPSVGGTRAAQDPGPRQRQAGPVDDATDQGRARGQRDLAEIERLTRGDPHDPRLEADRQAVVVEVEAVLARRHVPERGPPFVVRLDLESAAPVATPRAQRQEQAGCGHTALRDLYEQ